MKKKKNISKILLSVSGIIVLAKLLGFIKQMFLAHKFGASFQTDIISLSQGLVTDLDYVISQSLIIAFVPTYIRLKKKKPGEEKKFTFDTIIVFFVITVIVFMLIFFLAPLFSKVLAPSYESEKSEVLANYIRIASPVLILFLQIGILNALLKSNDIYIPGEFIGINQSIIIIVSVLAFGDIIGPNILLICFYIYIVFNFIFLLFFSKRFISVKICNPLRNKEVIQLLFMMGPILISTSLIFVNQQIDKVLVSGMGEGNVTALSYSAVLVSFVGAFISGVCSVFFTNITHIIAEKKEKTVSKLICKSSVYLITLLLPVVVVVVFNSKDIVSLLFGHGKFNEEAIYQCSEALKGYGFIFVPHAVKELFSRLQYGYGESKRPMINSSISILTNIILSVVLGGILGIFGITLASSISTLICCVLNFLSSRKINCFIKFQDYKNYLFRWIVGILICVSVSILGQVLLKDIQYYFRFVIILAITFCVYIVLTYPIVFPVIRKTFNLRKK